MYVCIARCRILKLTEFELSQSLKLTEFWSFQYLRNWNLQLTHLADGQPLPPSGELNDIITITVISSTTIMISIITTYYY